LKILFIHEVSYLKKPVYEIHEFPELLSVMGHEISFFEFDEGRKFWDASTIVKDEEVGGKVLPTAKITLIRPSQLGIPGIDRLFVVLSSFSKLRKIIKRHNYDVIVLYAVPTFGAQAIWFAKRRGIPVVFRALDVAHKIRESIFAGVIKKAERFVYTESDLLSSNNPAMERYCIKISGRTKMTIVHFPPLDLSHFQTAQRDYGLRNRLGISDSDKVIVYMGSFFYFSGLVDAIKEFAAGGSEHENIKLLLIGGGELDPELKSLTRDLGLSEKVIFTGYVPYEELPRYLALADVAVNTLESTLVANAAFPNKVLQYLASGLPVVSTKLEGLLGIFSESKEISWGSTPASVIKFAREITACLSQDLVDDKNQKFEPLLLQFLPEKAAMAFEASLIKLVESSATK
jgi:glycosyltransferase involved in cell wall biosynthesis